MNDTTASKFYIDNLWFPISDIDYENKIVYSIIYNEIHDWSFDEIDYFVDDDDNTVDIK